MSDSVAPPCPFTIVRTALASCALSMLITGCGASDNELRPAEEPPQELTAGSKPAVESPEAELLSDAKRYFEVGLYSVAKDLFEKLRDGYPLGAYAEFAELKIADCEFESSNFSVAAKLYEEFLKDRPASLSTPYATLRAARSNQLANRGLGRDDSTLRRASELYQQLLAQFPTSPYAEGARALLKQVNDTIAANERLVVEFYRKKEQSPAVQARAQRFQEKFGKDIELVSLEAEHSPPREPSAAAPRGTQVLFETSIGEVSAVGAAEQSSRKVAGAQRTRIQRDSDLPEATQPGGPAAAGRAKGAHLLVRLVECDRTKRLVFLHLSQPLSSPQVLESQSPLQSTEGTFQFSIPNLSTPGGKPLERDCFGSRDVTISAQGQVSIVASGSTAELMELSDPPRVLVAFTR